MSTKIYNGRLLAGSIGKVYDLLLEAKPEAKAIARRLEIAWMARRATAIIDDARIKGEEPRHPLGDAWQELMDRRRAIRREGQRDPGVDHEFEIWLFPRRGATLAIVNTEQRELRDWFDALPWVAEYAYYDNTDPPEEVTARQWDARRRAWDKALPGAGVPSERCLVFTMVSCEHIWFAEPAEALARVPPIGERLARVVDNRVREEHHARLTREEKERDPDFKPEGFSLFFKAVQAAKNDVEGRRAAEAEIAPFIRELTAQDLAGTQGRK